MMMQPVQFYDKEIETLDLEALQALQLIRLKDTVRRALRSPFYSERFNPLGLAPEEIQSISEIEALPFTVKGDLGGDAYPYGFLTVSKDHLVRLHASSETRADPR